MTDQSHLTKADILAGMDREWTRLQAFITNLTPQQLTQPADAAGWTVKDHLYHLAAWEIGMLALLNGGSMSDAMGVDEETWKSRDFDRINAVIFTATKQLPLDQVLATLTDTHHRAYAKFESMTEDDFHRPYNTYRPDSTNTRSILGWILGDSFEHYDEHIPWMTAIVNGSS